MRLAVSLNLFASIVLLSVAQSSSSKLDTQATTQDRDTVQRLYGSPVSEIYRASKNLIVTASFAPNGNLCGAHIKSDVDAGITDRELKAVLDELTPKDVRGEFKLGTFLNITCIKQVKAKNSTPDSNGKPAMELAVDPCAECSGVSDDYERVNITKYGNTNQYSSVHVTYRRPECRSLDKVKH